MRKKGKEESPVGLGLTSLLRPKPTERPKERYGYGEGFREEKEVEDVSDGLNPTTQTLISMRGPIYNKESMVTTSTQTTVFITNIQ